MQIMKKKMFEQKRRIRRVNSGSNSIILHSGETIINLLGLRKVHMPDIFSGKRRDVPYASSWPKEEAKGTSPRYLNNEV
jgi:antitoxin (DNA-binding transcriptional repressor) of toxin-antitoxin stability system